MKSLPVLPRAGILALILFGIVPALHSQKLVTFDVPGSSYTHPTAVNLTGRITGYYFESPTYHGFVRKPNGSFTSFDVPQPPDGFPPNALPMDINANGQITGFYAFEIQLHGFLRQKDGTVIKFLPPFSSSDAMRLALSDFVAYDRPLCGGEDRWLPLAINDVGQITGSGPGNSSSGFFRAVDGSITYFDIPPQSGIFGSTCPQAINIWGQVTGYYWDGAVLRGFLRQPDGSIVKFNSPSDAQTIPMAINFFGQVTGIYADSTGTHGFSRHPNGAIKVFDAPGGDTEPTAINALGEITGTCGGNGFLREPDGKIITFSVPNSQGTFPRSINLFGRITGYYFDGATYHGFVRDK